MKRAPIVPAWTWPLRSSYMDKLTYAQKGLGQSHECMLPHSCPCLLLRLHSSLHVSCPAVACYLTCSHDHAVSSAIFTSLIATTVRSWLAPVVAFSHVQACSPALAFDTRGPATVRAVALLHASNRNCRQHSADALRFVQSLFGCLCLWTSLIFAIRKTKTIGLAIG